MAIPITASADTITLGITTAGCFTSGSTCGQYAGGMPGTLTFTGVTNSPNSQVTLPPDLAVNLGSFTLGDNGQSGLILDTTFTGLVSFVSPAGATGQIFLAQLTGAIVKNKSGLLAIDFDNTPILITFSNGSFLLSVNDLVTGVSNPNPGAEFVTANWTGTVSDLHVTPVPEPASLTLMGAGILGIAGLLRSRLRA